MGVSGQGGFAHLPEQLQKCGAFVEFAADDQRVHEKADDALDFRMVAVGDGRADQNVFLTGITIEQRLKSGQQNHEIRGARLFGQLF